MLEITIPAVKAKDGDEFWDDEKQEFIYADSQPAKREQTLQLEHSLISLSLWESKWKKPFFSRKEKTEEETIDYIRCMTLTPNIDPEVYERIDRETMIQISEYIEDPMTATTFFSDGQRGGNNGETTTSELIYYWMLSLQIPFECEKWHLNRLLTLIKICNIKNQSPKKRSKRETASRFAALNAARRKQLNTKG